MAARGALSLVLLSACTGRLESGLPPASVDGSVLMDLGTPLDGAPATDMGTALIDGGHDAGVGLPGGNLSPVAYGETFYTLVNASVSITDVRANDSDADGDALSVSAHSMPSHGTLRPKQAQARSRIHPPAASSAKIHSRIHRRWRRWSDTAIVNIHVAHPLL
ncbi:MAG: hypothetical protein IPK60_25710 [Sandaracinaceae bacterium]|nr:hypothetical protein [Sandaracinaceae bacterium]